MGTTAARSETSSRPTSFRYPAPSKQKWIPFTRSCTAISLRERSNTWEEAPPRCNYSVTCLGGTCWRWRRRRVRRSARRQSRQCWECAQRNVNVPSHTGWGWTDRLPTLLLGWSQSLHRLGNAPAVPDPSGQPIQRRIGVLVHGLRVGQHLDVPGIGPDREFVVASFADHLTVRLFRLVMGRKAQVPQFPFVERRGKRPKVVSLRLDRLVHGSAQARSTTRSPFPARFSTSRFRLAPFPCRASARAKRHRA